MRSATTYAAASELMCRVESRRHPFGVFHPPQRCRSRVPPLGKRLGDGDVGVGRELPVDPPVTGRVVSPAGDLRSAFGAPKGIHDCGCGGEGE